MALFSRVTREVQYKDPLLLDSTFDSDLFKPYLFSSVFQAYTTMYKLLHNDVENVDSSDADSPLPVTLLVFGLNHY